MNLKDLTPEQLEIIKRLAREETDEEKAERLRKQEELEKKAAEDAKKSPYRQFLQVNQDNYKAEDWLMKKSPAAYRVLRFIAKNMDNYNALICSYTVFAETLGYSRQTIFSAIKLLKEKKFIDVVKSGNANVYLINKELYWHSYGTNYARAEFGAKIIISADEQQPAEREGIKLKAKRYKAIEFEGESQPQQAKTTTEKATA